MKLSELGPCSACGGAPGNAFFVVRSSVAIISPMATRGVVGVAQMLGGIDRPGVLRVAEALAPDAEAVKIAGDERAELWAAFRLCMECATRGHDNLPALISGDSPDAHDRSEQIRVDLLAELRGEIIGFVRAAGGVIGLPPRAAAQIRAWRDRFLPPEEGDPDAPEPAPPPAV